MARVGPHKLISRRLIYRNPWLSLTENTVERPDRARSVFGIVEMKPGATVVAVNGEGEVVLVREFKIAVGRETLEAVSGGIEDGETPLDAAKRELREEAGVEAAHWTSLGVVDPFTTAINSPNHIFLASGLKPAEASPDEGETVETILVPFAEAIEMVMRSEITHGATCVALLKAIRHLDGCSHSPASGVL